MFSEYWICWHCLICFQVPTTGYYGNCPDCGKPTQPWLPTVHPEGRIKQWLITHKLGEGVAPASPERTE